MKVLGKARVSAYQLAELPSRSGQDSVDSSLWDLLSPDCRTPPSTLWLPTRAQNTHTVSMNPSADSHWHCLTELSGVM